MHRNRINIHNTLTKLYYWMFSKWQSLQYYNNLTIPSLSLSASNRKGKMRSRGVMAAFPLFVLLLLTAAAAAAAVAGGGSRITKTRNGSRSRSVDRSQFPPSFLFGTATSSYQVIWFTFVSNFFIFK